MKIDYHPETHSLWVILADRPSADTDEIAPGVNVDFDAEGRLVALEVLDTRQLAVSELEVSGVPLIKVLSQVAAAVPLAED